MNAVAEHPYTELRSTVEPFWGAIVIRLATCADRPALERLAELDSATAPTGTTLLAAVHERIVAALSLGDGTEIADPFVATRHVLELLRVRARQLDAGGRRPGWRRPFRS